MRSILDGVTLGSAPQAKVHDPTIVEGDCHLEQEVCVVADCALVQMHVTDWAEAQKEDLMLNTVLDWLKAQKKTDLKALQVEHTSSEESWLILGNWQNLSKVPLHPIVATALMDLLHVDFTSIEMTLELNRLLKVANVLVFQDHFMKHVMAYVTPNQTAERVTKFLYQGYISIFGALSRLLSDQGANFMSSIIDEMCKLLGVKKL